MEKFVEERGANSFKVNCYKINVTKEMRDIAEEFAEKIITENNQYVRLLPSVARNNQNNEYAKKLEIQRTYVGKLGELVFGELLKEKGKSFDDDGMFEIYSGQSNVDNFDFITRDNETVDIKTGFLSNHKRLLVNEDQFSNIPKDYYVGVKLNCQYEDSKAKLIQLDSVVSAEILGYVEYSFLKRIDPVDFGEGLARSCFYNRLLGIDKLINKF